MVEAVPAKFGREIFKRLPRSTARVYLQLDPRFSFDTNLAIDKTKFLVKLCTDYHAIPKEQLTIKIPGSWEGIQAAR